MCLVCCWDEVGYLLVVVLVGLGVMGGADCGWFRMVDGGGCVCMWLLVVGWLGVARGGAGNFSAGLAFLLCAAAPLWPRRGPAVDLGWHRRGWAVDLGWPRRWPEFGLAGPAGRC